MATFAFLGSPVQAGHIGFDAGFIKKHQAVCRNFCLEFAPMLTLADYVFAFLFACPESFF